MTGGANGIGRAYCRRLVAEGCSLAIADRDLAAGRQLAQTLGSGAIAIQCDVSSIEDTQHLMEQTEQAFGGIDLLVNNAGIYPTTSFLDLSVDEWDRVLAVNLRGTFLCCKAVLPALRRRGGGRIVNISSGTALRPLPNLSHYIASKMGIIGLTRALAVELGPLGINVNVITPGITRDEEVAGKRAGEAVNEIVRQQCFQRPASPKELASALVFLLSEDSAFVTGQVLNIDGGWVLH